MPPSRIEGMNPKSISYYIVPRAAQELKVEDDSETYSIQHQGHMQSHWPYEEQILVPRG